MIAQNASAFFRSVVTIVKQDPANQVAVNTAAAEQRVRIISFTGDPLRCVFSFNKVAYQIIKRKKGFECASFGVTKH